MNDDDCMFVFIDTVPVDVVEICDVVTECVEITSGIRGEVGPAGPPGSGGIVDQASRASPQLVSASISVTPAQRMRIFIQGNGAPATNPTIPNGSGTQELDLFCCSDNQSVELNNTANLQINGQWFGINGSVLSLFWDGQSKWVEKSRNEI